MKASKILHRSEIRIRVDFGYNAELMSKLRQIADARWSKTMGAWHIPYTKEAFGQLKERFPDVEYEAEAKPILASKEASTKINSNENISQIKHLIKKNVDAVDNT